MIRQMQKTLNGMQAAADSVCIAGSLLLVGAVCAAFLQAEPLFWDFRQKLLACAVFVPIHMAMYGGFRLYRSYRASRFLPEFVTLLQANLCAYGVIAAVAYFLSVFYAVQVFITVYFFVLTAAQSGYRFALRKILRYVRRRGFNKKYVLLLGRNASLGAFVKKIHAAPDLGYEILGYMDENAEAGAALPYLGTLEHAEEYFGRATVDEAVLFPQDSRLEETARLMALCEKWGVKFTVVPDLFSLFSSRVFISSFDGMPVLNLRKIPLDSLANRFLKRTADIFISATALVLFSPLMGAVYLGVRLTSPGPAFFRQERVGLNRRRFAMYKFRSMTMENKPPLKMAEKDDPRCTRLGKILRKFSLDELPQLFNVLKGEMSLVGPRPEIPEFVEKFMQSVPSYMQKHSIKPGMTGWAQIHGLRGRTSIPERIRYDLYYIENWTFFLDIKILFLTIFKGIFSKNAY